MESVSFAHDYLADSKLDNKVLFHFLGTDFFILLIKNLRKLLKSDLFQLKKKKIYEFFLQNT